MKANEPGGGWNPLDTARSVGGYIADHKAGVLQGVSIVAGGTAIILGTVAVPVTGGASLSLTAVGWGALTAGGVSAAAGIASQAVDPKPCRGERIASTAVLTVFTGFVGGGLAAGGSSALSAGASTVGLTVDNTIIGSQSC
jgi:hypothetical protein